MTPLEMYLERASECRREAEASTLINVRNRCLSAADAWQNMADRAQQNELYRAREAERKAEQEVGQVADWRLMPPTLCD
jgi:hypothetical protein